MAEKLTPAEIRDYWTRQATAHGSAPSASWTDVGAIELEIRAISRRLADGDRVLDVGCANGYSTLEYAVRKQLRIKGVDYVPEMIAIARQRLQEEQRQTLGVVEFAVGDAMALDEADETYDKAIVVRVIINLGVWEQQRRALRECARVVRRGGLLLVSEATLQGWSKLNQFRTEWGLPPIVMPAFNQYVDEEKVVEAAAPQLELLEVENFASTYSVATRVIKPLLARAAASHVDVADPQMHWNRWSAQLPACGDYGTQKLFVFRKR
jgi:ubiquinone/menaquinone biosynthesis C-methylase UbiE